jgi:hypothetical protein
MSSLEYECPAVEQLPAVEGIADPVAVGQFGFAASAEAVGGFEGAVLHAAIITAAPSAAVIRRLMFIGASRFT